MLSICLIARNEEASLPRALKSVRSIADEIIVVDTGSTDRTVEVAREHGAMVHHFAWCDDFSAARNFAIDQAHGDWILWLDADEELLPESIEELRASLGREDVLGFTLLFQDLQRADRPDFFTLMRHLRLFRRRSDLRFQGRCHPHFEPDLWQLADVSGLKIEDSSITIRHYGYVVELRAAKLQRGTRLLELELKDRPGQFYYLVEYGRSLLIQGDERGHGILAEAAAQLLPFSQALEPPQSIAGLLLEYLLHVPPEQLPAGFTAELVQDLVRRWFPDAPHLLWLLARQRAERGAFVEAERILRRLVQMGTDHSYDKTVSFDPGFVGEKAKMNLGICLVRQRRLVEAREIFQGLLASPEQAQQARENLRVIDQVLNQFSGGISYSFS